MCERHILKKIPNFLNFSKTFPQLVYSVLIWSDLIDSDSSMLRLSSPSAGGSWNQTNGTYGRKLRIIVVHLWRARLPSFTTATWEPHLWPNPKTYYHPSCLTNWHLLYSWSTGGGAIEGESMGINSNAGKNSFLWWTVLTNHPQSSLLWAIMDHRWSANMNMNSQISLIITKKFTKNQ